MFLGREVIGGGAELASDTLLDGRIKSTGVGLIPGVVDITAAIELAALAGINNQGIAFHFPRVKGELIARRQLAGELRGAAGQLESFDLLAGSIKVEDTKIGR